METMRAIVLVTCVISILSGLLDVLKPSAKFDRQLRLLLASVFVLGIFTPLSRGAAEFQPNWDCAAEQETLRCAAGNLEESLAAMLRQNGIPDARVQVEMNIAEDNSIEIEQVTVACRDAAAAGQLLTDCLGKEVNIHVETDS